MYCTRLCNISMRIQYAFNVYSMSDWLYLCAVALNHFLWHSYINSRDAIASKKKQPFNLIRSEFLDVEGNSKETILLAFSMFWLESLSPTLLYQLKKTTALAKNWNGLKNCSFISITTPFRNRFMIKKRGGWGWGYFVVSSHVGFPHMF